MKLRRVLLIGHSHIQCLVQAHSNRFRDDFVLESIHLYKDKIVGHEPHFRKYVMEKVAALPTQDFDLVVACLGGNSHNVLGLVRMEPPFDYVLASKTSLGIEADAVLVPERIVQGALETRSGPPLTGLGVIKEIFGDKLVSVESPPPLGDDTYVRQYLDEYFIKEFPGNREIVSAELRYKLWRTASEIYERQCDKLNIPYLQCPQSALMEGMYLRPEGYPKNVTHGNAWYGERVWENLVRWASEREACVS